MLDGRGHMKKARQVGGQDPWEVWNSSATDNGGWHAEHNPLFVHQQKSERT